MSGARWRGRKRNSRFRLRDLADSANLPLQEREVWMREWLLASAIALSLLKVYTDGTGQASFQVGAPWLLPFDSPAGACIRAMDETLLECGVGSVISRKSLAWTFTSVPMCKWCFDASIWLSELGRDRGSVERRKDQLRGLETSAQNFKDAVGRLRKD